MMAGLFLLYAFVLGLVGIRQRRLAILLIILNMVLCLAMFWWHVTDTLKIMW